MHSDILGLSPGEMCVPGGAPGGQTLACQDVEPTPILDPSWRYYWGGRAGEILFHCSGHGYLENRPADPQYRINECVYDKISGQLITSEGPYPGCAGTPNQYDERDKHNHIFHDEGGPANIPGYNPGDWGSHIGAPIDDSIQWLIDHPNRNTRLSQWV